MNYWRKDAWSFFLFFSLLSLGGIFLAGCNNQDITGSGGSKPTITGMSPSQVAAGQQNINGHITGTNFKGIVAVDLGAGIDIKNTNRTSDTDITVTFSVHADAAPGPRTVKVATVDGVATSDSLLSVSDNKPPVAQFSVSPNDGGLDTVFQFDGSGSHDPDGSIKGYAWDFGDGNKTNGQKVDHKYGSAATFHPKLTVTDNHDATANATKDVTVKNIRPPVAHFTVTPPHGDAKTNFEFDGTNSTDDGRVVKWDWIFGDGTGGQGRTIHHHFSKAHTYGVQLSVTDNDGLTSTAVKDVEVIGKAPVASFSVTPSFGDVSTTFTFDASTSSDSDGSIGAYTWNFGDGQEGTGKIVQHKYATTGTRGVELTVTDNDGQHDTALHDVEIDPPIPPGGLTCTTPSSRQGTGIYGTVLQVDPAGSNVLIKFQYTDHHGIIYEDYNCSNAYFKCGDLDPQGETSYYGEICKMVYYGNNTFRIYTKGAKAWPSVGQQNVFEKWQTCGIHSICP